jgi:hypothetical protein
MTPDDKPELDLRSVSAPPLLDDQGDMRLAHDEERWFSKARGQVHLKGLIDDQEARKKWGERVFWLLVGWLLADFLCVCFQGFRWNEFHVSDAIVIALISTTTVNVLGLGYIVANYLFPKSTVAERD